MRSVGIELTLTIRKEPGTIWYLVVLGDSARHSNGLSFVLRFRNRERNQWRLYNLSISAPRRRYWGRAGRRDSANAATVNSNNARETMSQDLSMSLYHLLGFVLFMGINCFPRINCCSTISLCSLYSPVPHGRLKDILLMIKHTYWKISFG